MKGFDRLKRRLDSSSRWGGGVQIGAHPPTHTFDDSDLEIMRLVRPHTMTSDLRLEALLVSVRHLIGRNVAGSFVECGVWRGGSVLAILLQLRRLGVDDRDVYLFDTFEGMTRPTEHDTSAYDKPALEVWNEAVGRDEMPWGGMFSRDLFSEESVRDLLLETGYPPERIHLVRGPVEETVPEEAPETVALLRLDTDWYGSTLHEMIHLYPRLSDGGVLIIDDYGHWDGCRRAVDEYFEDGPVPRPLLHRVDYTCRIGIRH